MMRKLMAVGSLVLAASVVQAAQLGGRPAEEWVRTLDGTIRISSLKIDDVVAAMKLERGQVVADIGAGTGLLSVPVARAVGPDGRVYAVEIDAGFFPVISQRAEAGGVANVQTVLGGFDDPKLPAANIDLAFFHDVMHHIRDRGAYLETLAKYLSPAGRILVVDFEAGMGPHAQQPEMQVPREQLTTFMADAGFVQSADARLFSDKYVLTFIRR